METPTLTHEAASQWLGKLASLILIRTDANNFDYAKIGIVRDSKKGIHFQQSIAKLSVQWSKMRPDEHKIIGLISQYLVDGGEEYADDPKFMVGLMGRIPLSPNDEVTPKRLREIREELGLTQLEFSVWLGLDAETKQTVQNWELGTRKIPAPIIEILRLRGKLGDGAL